MCMLEFGEIEIAFKGFHQQKQVINIFSINVSTLVTSKGDRCNHWKDSWYILGYQVDGKAMVPILVNITKKIFCYNVSQYGKKPAFTMTFNVSE